MKASVEELPLHFNVAVLADDWEYLEKNNE